MIVYFPFELIVYITKFMNPKDVLSLASTCKKLSVLSKDDNQAYYGHFTQAKAMFQVKQGKNTFLHGPGGCGKSFTINLIAEHFTKLNKKIAFVSMFGRAASNINNGMTICAFMGTGKMNRKEWFTDEEKGDKRKRRAGTILKDLDALVIDEISTTGRTCLENIDRIAKYVKHTDEPMGGIQVIVCGDFWQLEPIGDTVCWKSPIYRDLQLNKVEYTYSFRQREILFSKLLQRLRIGTYTQADINLLRSRIKQAPESAFFIYGDNKRADQYNKERLRKIPFPKQTFRSEFEIRDKAEVFEELGKFRTMTRAEILKKVADSYGHIHPEILEVKEGCSVLLMKNISVSKGYCNGAQGKFHTRDGKWYFELDKKNIADPDLELNICKFCIHISPRYFVIRHGLPIRLGYAGTVHSVQGITLNEVSICLDRKINRKGQAYTAISRVTDINSLYFSALDENYIKTYGNSITI